MTIITTTPDGVRFRVHIQPGALRTEIAGVYGDAIKLRLAALPIDGKANEALLRFLSETFRVPRRNVTLVRGVSSRAKVVELAGVDLAAARRLLCI